MHVCSYNTIIVTLMHTISMGHIQESGLCRECMMKQVCKCVPPTAEMGIIYHIQCSFVEIQCMVFLCGGTWLLFCSHATKGHCVAATVNHGLLSAHYASHRVMLLAAGVTSWCVHYDGYDSAVD